MHSAHSYKRYRASATMLEEKNDHVDIEHVCCRAYHPHEKNKHEPFECSNKINGSDKSSAYQAASDDSNKSPKETVASNDNAVVKAETEQGESMRWHLRLGHMSFRKHTSTSSAWSAT